MSAAEFLDTNILVYAFSFDERSERATELLAAGRTVGVQGLNEFTNVARRKLAMSWSEVDEALTVIRMLCGAVEMSTLAVHKRAVDLAKMHNFAMFDAVMLATALEAKCTIFWSEDLQHAMQIDRTMTIRNPFLA